MTGMKDGDKLSIYADSEIVAKNVTVCVSKASRRDGLLGKSGISLDEGILMVMPTGRGNSGWLSAIHMFFMRFAIAVIWIDQSHKVVHVANARPWGIYYPPVPAKYVLEVHPDLLKRFVVGDLLAWEKMPVVKS